MEGGKRGKQREKGVRDGRLGEEGGLLASGSSTATL